MKPTDFGVDLDTLPKLKFDEDAGRKVIERMSRIPAYHDTVKFTKLTYFMHHVSHHLDLETKKIELNDIDAIEKELIPMYPLIWEQVSRVIDRHIFMFTAMFNSFEVNVENEDDLEVIGCHVYSELVSIPVFALLLGDVQMMQYSEVAYKTTKNRRIDTFFEYIMMLKDLPKANAGMFRHTMQDFILSALDDESKTYKNAYKDD